MVFAISLSSYIALCYASLNLSTRTVAISHSNELGETGIEYALYALNTNDWSSYTISGTTATATMTMTSSGLALTSTNPTPLNYGNGVTGQVLVTVANYSSINNNTSPGPSITATTTMTLPAYSKAGTTRTVSTTSSYGSSASPATAATPLFVNAVAAISGAVAFKSAGTVDSYNSNPLPGVYQNYSAAVAGFSAIILSQDTTTSSASVKLKNAVVQGYAVGYNHSSPSSTNWFSYSASGKIVGPNTPAGTSIDSSRLETTAIPYQPFLMEKMPTNYTTLPTPIDRLREAPLPNLAHVQTQGTPRCSDKPDGPLRAAGPPGASGRSPADRGHVCRGLGRRTRARWRAGSTSTSATGPDGSSRPTAASIRRTGSSSATPSMCGAWPTASSCTTLSPSRRRWSRPRPGTSRPSTPGRHAAHPEASSRTALYMGVPWAAAREAQVRLKDWGVRPRRLELGTPSCWGA
jgi:hypothetical protein